MKMIGILFLTIGPLIIGGSSLSKLYSRKSTLYRIYSGFKTTVAEIEFSKTEIKEIFLNNGLNLSVFNFDMPISVNINECKLKGLNKSDIEFINGFLNTVQYGDRQYIEKNSKIFLKKVEESYIKAKEDFLKTGKINGTLSVCLSLVIFLLLI